MELPINTIVIMFVLMAVLLISLSCGVKQQSPPGMATQSHGADAGEWRGRGSEVTNVGWGSD